MPYAVTLRLNDKAAAPVERMWHALAEHTGDDDVVRVGYAPHITLAWLPDSVPAEVIEDAVFGTVNTWEAVPIVLAGLGIFPGTPPVVWAAPVVTERLLTLHSKLHSALGPLGVHPHHRPGAWMPRVTLSQHGRSPTARLVEAAASAWPGPISGEANRIDFLRFHPVSVLRSVALQPPG